QVRTRLQKASGVAVHGEFASKTVEPTAMQKVAVGQDTPDNRLSTPGAGAASTCHSLPFHASATVAGSLLSPSMLAPTARHMDALTQDTRVNPKGSTPHGFRSGNARHLVPFHAAALSHGKWFRDITEPTAMQNDRRVHEIPARARPRG